MTTDLLHPSGLQTVEYQGADADQIYAGFWIRLRATIIDTVLLLLVTAPLLVMIYGKVYFLDTESTFAPAGPADVLITYALPAIVVLVFWMYKSATPGKMILNMKIVDAKTGENASVGQLAIRYIGYYVAMIPLFSGLIWVAFDKRKQGWHDKLAGTVVVKVSPKG